VRGGVMRWSTNWAFMVCGISLVAMFPGNNGLRLCLLYVDLRSDLVPCASPVAPIKG
jgi:hypothetical protein